MNECMRLQSCFPQVPPGVILVLTQRIIDKGMSFPRLKDAIDNLIDNFKYPVFTVADIITWDKLIKTYTHQEAKQLIGDQLFSNVFKIIEVEGEKRWIKK